MMHKPSIAVIMGGGKPPPAEESSGELPEDHEYEDGDLEEKGKEAAGEFADAIKSGDSEKIWTAFQAMHRCEHAVMDKEDEGGEEHEEEEEGEEEEK